MNYQIFLQNQNIIYLFNFNIVSVKIPYFATLDISLSAPATKLCSALSGKAVESRYKNEVIRFWDDITRTL